MFPLMTVMPRGFSLGVYYHYAQIVNAKGRFQMWNYGKRKNRVVYQSEQPPEYPVEKIQVPVYLMSSTGDSCATTGVRINFFHFSYWSLYFVLKI